MRSNLLIFIFLIFITSKVYNQNFVQIQDATGFEYSETDLDSLNILADSIINVLPDQFKDKFKVLDFGYYCYNNNMVEGIPEIWDDVILKSNNMSEFYLLVGRFVDFEGKIHTFHKLKLPTNSIFACYLDSDWELLNAKISKGLNEFNIFNYCKILHLIKDKIFIMSYCCLQGLRTYCEYCKSSEDIEIMFKNRDGYNENKSTCEINTEEYNNNNESQILIGEDYWELDYDGENKLILNTVNKFDSLVNNLGLTFQAFVTSNSTTCYEMKYNDVEDRYKRSTADVKLRLHIDEETGRFFEHVDSDGIFDYYQNVIYSNWSDIIEQEDYENQQGQNSSACKENEARLQIPNKILFKDGTDVGYTKEQGNFAHAFTQIFYKSKFGQWDVNNPAKIEYSIPESSKYGTGKTGFADIVNLMTREIFEIKSIFSVNAAKVEVERYVDKADEFCITTDQWNPYTLLKFKKGIDFYNKIEYPVSPTQELIVKIHTYGSTGSVEKGVISYRYEEKNQERKPVPSPKPVVVPLPESSWKKISNVVKQMAGATNPNEIAWNFFNVERALVNTCITLGVVAIVVNVAGTLVSEGGYAPVGVPLIISCGILVSVAWSFDPNSPPPGGT
jgi:hypothetical protein